MINRVAAISGAPGKEIPLTKLKIIHSNHFQSTKCLPARKQTCKENCLMLTVWWPAHGSEWEELRPQVIQRFLVGDGDVVQLRGNVQVPFVSVDVRLTLLQAFLRPRERAELLRENQRCCGLIVCVFQGAEFLQEMHHQPFEAGLGKLHADNGVMPYCGANSLCSFLCRSWSGGNSSLSKIKIVTFFFFCLKL